MKKKTYFLYFLLLCRYLYYNVNTQKKPNTYILSIYNLNNDHNQLSKIHEFNSFIIEDFLFFNRYGNFYLFTFQN